MADHHEDPELLTAIRGLLLILERPEDIKINSNNNQVRDCVALLLEYLGEDVKDNDQILGVIVAYIQRWQESTVSDQIKWVETMERYAAGYLGLNISKQSNLLKSILSKGSCRPGHD